MSSFWDHTGGLRWSNAPLLTLGSFGRYSFPSNVALSGKDLLKVRGFFGYYLSFAGPFFSFVNRVLRLRNKTPFRFRFLKLLRRDFLTFRSPPEASMAYHSDATPNCIASINTVSRRWNILHMREQDIKETELRAALSICIQYLYVCRFVF